MTDIEMKTIKKVAELPYAWESLENKRILISGGTGFIGSFLTEVLRYRVHHCENHIRVVSLSRRGGCSDDVLESLKVDVRNPICYDKSVDFVILLRPIHIQSSMQKTPLDDYDQY